MATYMKRPHNGFRAVCLMNLSLFICLTFEIGLISAGAFETSEGPKNEQLYDRNLNTTLEHIGTHDGEEIYAELNLQKQEVVVANLDAPTLSAKNSSVPVDFLQVLASHMTHDVFHQVMKGLNKTLDTRIRYSHPNFTHATELDETQGRKVKYPCMRRPAGNRTAQVRIVNNTELIEFVSAVYNPAGQENSSSALRGYCAFVMFYAPWCKFSAKAAPAFNAIGRAFPDLEVLAVDAFQHNSLNTRFGIVAVPNVLLFHNNKPVMRFNYSERTFEVFSQFIQTFTGLEPNSSVQVSEIDSVGPLPSLATEETDYALWLSWLLLIGAAVWFLEQRLGIVIRDRVRTFVIYARQVWRTGELYDQVGVLVHEHHD